jgi:ParB family chromosome partitioning protein
VRNEAYKRIENNLASYFSTKVLLHHNSTGKGSITIEYYSPEELNKILELMNVQAD